jgi:hypothetical protein
MGDEYESYSSKPMPVAWTSPETLARRVTTTQSDVW